ncbi:hypothetical protein [Halosegnis marinus]|uniref:Uncharacterized protein n=1 Tax=Halosegnis marinus TaxID=3034023 RepID=A0ABD5ZNZ1_9EURY|nr:hypothetical protein [Halosegnis sp. DT85]
MARTGTTDYGRLTKSGVALGLALLVVSIGVELAAAGLHYPLPAWEDTLFMDLGVIGLLLFVLSPFVFGIVLPLVE